MIAGKQKCSVSIVHFNGIPFMCSCEGKEKKGKQKLNDYKFFTFTGRFPSDGAASLAVKGLRL